jgi:hypothetical protein
MKRVLFACLLGLGACSSLTDNQEIGLAGQAGRPITCTGSDCEVKWARALQWVHTNSAYPVQSQSDTLIQTETPSSVSQSSGFTITKRPAGNNLYVIDFASGCGALASCEPSSLELKASFVTYVADNPIAPGQ